MRTFMYRDGKGERDKRKRKRVEGESKKRNRAKDGEEEIRSVQSRQGVRPVQYTGRS